MKPAPIRCHTVREQGVWDCAFVVSMSTMAQLAEAGDDVSLIDDAINAANTFVLNHREALGRPRFPAKKKKR